MKFLFLLFLVASTYAYDNFYAKYEVEFESSWNDNYVLGAHTSKMFGGGHNSNWSLFQEGQPSGSSLKDIAELGSTTKAEAEWDQDAGANTQRPFAEGDKITGPGSTTFHVTVSKDFSLVSFASMLAPSTDWFVGVDSLELYDSSGSEWKDHVEVELFALDAGTKGNSTSEGVVSRVESLDTTVLGRLHFRLQVPTNPPLVPDTVFTFAFDDTFKDGMEMADRIEECGWRGTFYISGLRLCLHPDYLDRGDVNELYRRGHQIGGHSLSHAKLFELSQPQLDLQVCGNLQLLRAYKWWPTTHAYPFAQYNTTIRKTVQQCGYCNARSTSAGLKSENCPTCDVAESIPPLDKWRIRSYSVKTTDTLQDLMQRVRDAINLKGVGKKWVIFNFHKICSASGDRCNTRYDYSTLRKDFNEFVRWLKLQVDDRVLDVKTVKQVMHALNDPPLANNPRSAAYEVRFDSDTITIEDGDEITSSAVKMSIAAILGFVLLLA